MGSCSQRGAVDAYGDATVAEAIQKGVDEVLSLNVAVTANHSLSAGNQEDYLKVDVELFGLLRPRLRGPCFVDEPQESPRSRRKFSAVRVGDP